MNGVQFLLILKNSLPLGNGLVKLHINVCNLHADDDERLYCD